MIPKACKVILLKQDTLTFIMSSIYALVHIYDMANIATVVHHWQGGREMKFLIPVLSSEALFSIDYFLCLTFNYFNIRLTLAVDRSARMLDDMGR
jgi:hypothetical protein